MDTVIEILIDVSGSMGTMKGQGIEHENKYLLPDGSTRISLAKKFLSNEILPTIDYAAKIIIRTFKADNAQGARPVIPVIYTGGYNKALINETFATLPNDTIGGTPITAAVVAAVEDLKSVDYINYERLIILVTDGGENGGGDYMVAAENAMSIDGIKCKVHIVGISLDNEAERKAMQLAETTQGIYLPLKATNYNSLEIRKALSPLKVSVVQESLRNIKSNEESEKANPATVAKIEALEKKLETIVNQKEINSLADQIEILKSKIDEVQIKNQKLISEFSALLDKQQLPLLIRTVEKNISQKLTDSISGLQKSIEELSSRYTLMNAANANKFEKLEAYNLGLFMKTDDLVHNQSTQITSYDEILKKLSALENVVNLISKRQQVTSSITWVLIVLGIISFIILGIISFIIYRYLRN